MLALLMMDGISYYHFFNTFRSYKQKVFSLLKPDHYHCKGSYDYYIQVFAD